MVEQEKFDKEQLKNKRIVKGTPLYRYASRYAKYFALSLGCAHVAIAAIIYVIDVPIELITAGPRQIAEGAARLGMYDKHSDDTEMRFEQIKADIKTTPGYSAYIDSTAYIQGLQERYFSQKKEKSIPADLHVAEEEPNTTASATVKEASK